MRVSLNALASVLEALAMGVMLFALYWFLAQTLPMEEIGIYSLVLSSMAFGFVANLGMAQAAMHFVPRAMAEGDQDRALGYADTIFLTLLVIFIVMALVMYWPIVWLLSGIEDLQGPRLELAKALVPWALFSLILANVGLAAAAVIRALHRAYLASIVTVAGSVIQFVIAYLYVPTDGLIAMGWAQTVQSAFVLIAALLLVWRLMPGASLIPYRFRMDALKDTLAYGSKLVVAGLFLMFLQPVTKFFLGHFAGLAAVGYYEFVERLMLRIGRLITQTNNVLIPAMSQLSVHEKDKMRDLYRSANRVVWLSSVILFAGLAAGLPAIESLWLDESGTPFVTYGLMLCVAQSVSVMASPSYSLGLGVGIVRWNIIGIGLQFALNVVLGSVLGMLYGAIGVVAGVMLAIILGNVVLLLGNAGAIVGRDALELKTALASLGVAALGCAGAFAAHSVFEALAPSGFWTAVLAAIAVIGAALAPSLLFHPGAREVLGALRRRRAAP